MGTPRPDAMMVVGASATGCAKGSDNSKLRIIQSSPVLIDLAQCSSICANRKIHFFGPVNANPTISPLSSRSNTKNMLDTDDAIPVGPILSHHRHRSF